MRGRDIEEIGHPALEQRAARAVGVRDGDVVERARRQRRGVGRDHRRVHDGHGGGRTSSEGHGRSRREVSALDDRGGPARRRAGGGRDREWQALRNLGRVAGGVGRGGRNVLAGPDLNGDGEVEEAGPAAVGRRHAGAEVDAALEVLVGEGNARGVRKEVEVECGVGRAVECTDDVGVPCAWRRRGDDRKILPVVGASIAVARVVGKDGVGAETYPETVVRVDQVGADGVPGPGEGVEKNPEPEGRSHAVVSDQVSGARSGAADLVVVRHAAEVDAVLPVRDRQRSCRIHPDEVALDDDGRRRERAEAGNREIDCVVRVTRDEVPFPGRRPADRHVGGAVEQKAGEGGAEGRGSRGVGPDVIALDDDAADGRAVGVFERDVGPELKAVGRNHVAVGRTGPADGDVG